jgi:hypothetical protein
MRYRLRYPVETDDTTIREIVLRRATSDDREAIRAAANAIAQETGRPCSPVMAWTLTIARLADLPRPAVRKIAATDLVELMPLIEAHMETSK